MEQFEDTLIDVPIPWISGIYIVVNKQGFRVFFQGASVGFRNCSRWTSKKDD